MLPAVSMQLACCQAGLAKGVAKQQVIAFNNGDLLQAKRLHARMNWFERLHVEETHSLWCVPSCIGLADLPEAPPVGHPDHAHAHAHACSDPERMQASGLQTSPVSLPQQHAAGRLCQRITMNLPAYHMKLLVSQQSITFTPVAALGPQDPPFLHWKFCVRGSNALEFGCIPLQLQVGAVLPLLMMPDA
jgi:hypothetical protein